MTTKFNIDPDDGDRAGIRNAVSQYIFNVSDTPRAI